MFAGQEELRKRDRDEPSSLSFLVKMRRRMSQVTVSVEEVGEISCRKRVASNLDRLERQDKRNCSHSDDTRGSSKEICSLQNEKSSTAVTGKTNSFS